MDLFNNAAILPGKHFVSPYDDIELRVYSQCPTSYVMICLDIRKSPTLRLQCVNLAKKGGVNDGNDGNDEYIKYITSVGRGDVNFGFLGFVSMHFNGEKKNLEYCGLSPSKPLYCSLRSPVIRRSQLPTPLYPYMTPPS